MNRRLICATLALLAAGCTAETVKHAPASVEPERVRHYAVVCSSFSRTAQHAKWYWNSSTWIYRVLKEKYGYDHENIYYLYEDPTRAGRNEAKGDEEKDVVIDGQTNLENFRKLIAHLEGVVREDDQVFFFMIGHTGYARGDSWYDCVGPNLSSTEFGESLDRLKAREIHAVFSPCQAEGFIWKAGKPGRVVITSTRYNENNAAGVAEAAIRGLENLKYDRDGDGRLSLYEAYWSIVDEQQKWYKKRGWAQREHALLDDDGDAKGHYLPDQADQGDGEFAKTAFIGDDGRPLTLPPEALQELGEYNRKLTLDKTLNYKTDGR